MSARLHLPRPHQCPACGGPHQELPTAAELRPYFGTYINPPPIADRITIAGGVINTVFGPTATEMLRLTVDRTGYWAASGYLENGSGGSEGSTFAFTLDLRYNGVSQASVAGNAQANSSDWGIGAHVTTPILITNGQTIALWASKNGPTSATVGTQALRAFFVPTPTYST